MQKCIYIQDIDSGNNIVMVFNTLWKQYPGCKRFPVITQLRQLKLETLLLYTHAKRTNLLRYCLNSGGK